MKSSALSYYRLAGLLFVVSLSLFISASLSKQVSGSMKTWDFEKRSCFFLTRFGTKHQSGKFDFHHQVNWMDTEQRIEYGDMKGEILILDEEGHTRAQQLLLNFSTAIKQEVSSSLLKEFPVHLFHDGSDSASFTLDSSSDLYYFYFCDSDREVVGSYQRRNEAHERDLKKTMESGDPSQNTSWKADKFISGTIISYELNIIDKVGYHQSLEEDFNEWISLGFCTIYVILFSWVSIKMKRFHRKNESLDHPLFNLWAILLLEMSSLGFQFIKSFLYRTTGQDALSMDLFSKLCFLLSDGALATFFIMMSKGWGVVSLHLVFDFELEMALGIVLLMSRYIWVLIGYFTDSQNENLYHMYDGVIGKLEILNLFVFYLWFQWSISTRDIFKQQKYKSLSRQILAIGSLYYLIRPLLVLCLLFIPLAYQLGSAYFLTVASHVIVCLILSITLTDQRGSYMKISISNGIELAGNTRLN